MTSPALHRRIPTFARILDGLSIAWSWLLRRLRMNVRSMMLVVLVVGALLGWMEYQVRIQRDAVAAIQQAGGQFYYDWEWINGRPSPGSQPRWPGWLIKTLGPDYFGQVVAVQLPGLLNPTDEALLAHVGRLKRLESLSLQRTVVSDSGLACLQDLTNLKSLRLSQSGSDPYGLAKLGLGPRLDLTKSGPGRLKHLRGMVNLENLSLSDFALSDADLAHLSGMTRMTNLDLRGEQITNAGLAHLRGMTRLTSLSLLGTKITNLEPIRGLDKLKILDLRGSAIDDAGLAPIREFPNLLELRLGETKIADSAMAHIAKHSLLEDIQLHHTAVTDEGLAQLRDLPRLRSLTLSRTLVTEQGVAILVADGKLPILRWLALSGPGTTSSGIESLRSQLPGVQIRGPH